MKYEIQDSGQRTHFKTGARRDLAAGKGRFDLLPAIAIERLARHFESGAAKYDDRNWERGIPLNSFLDSALRHLNKWSQGKIDEDHLAAVLWNIACLIWTIDKIQNAERPEVLIEGLPEEVREQIRTTIKRNIKNGKTKRNTRSSK